MDLIVSFIKVKVLFNWPDTAHMAMTRSTSSIGVSTATKKGKKIRRGKPVKPR